MTGQRPLSRGDIVLIRFPFSDLSGSKIRPTCVLGFAINGDVILAFITSRIKYGGLGAVVVLNEHTEVFPRTGLRVSSAIQLDKLATLSRSLLVSRIGSVDSNTRGEMNRILHQVLDL